METIKEKNFISSVVYCHNDEHTIGEFIQSLDNMLDTHFLHYEIIIVNDVSTDNSMSIIRQFASHTEEKVITILNMSHHQGLEASMNAGQDLAIGDFVYEFDSAYADFDWSVPYDAYKKMLEGHDIISAQVNTNLGLTTRLYYNLFNRYANLPTPIGSDIFRLLSRRAINRIHSISEVIPFRKAAYANCGLSTSRISYSPIRKTIHKKHTDRSDVVKDSLILFTDVAYRITVSLACIMAITTAFFAIYAFFYWLTSNPVEGWTTTIIFLAFGFFGLFIILSIVIKYLQVIVKLTFHKKQYLFESIEKLQ